MSLSQQHLCDHSIHPGVLWHGDSALPGAPETVSHLKSLGKKLVFVTNNSSKSRSTYKDKFARLGFKNVGVEDIITSASATASFCKRNGLSKVFVVGEAGVLEECALQQVKTVTLASTAEHTCSMDEFEMLNLDDEVAAVVVGWDKSFSFRKLCLASLYLQRGRRLIATNPDTGIKAGNGTTMPGNGCALAAIQASSTAVAEVIGKPSDTLMKELLQTYGMNADETLMIGDRLDTDILFAQSCDVDTLLVLTGCSTAEDARDEQLPTPTIIADSVEAAFRFQASRA